MTYSEFARIKLAELTKSRIKMIKLAIVSPCYNEEEVLEQSAARLTALFEELITKKKSVPTVLYFCE